MMPCWSFVVVIMLLVATDIVQGFVQQQASIHHHHSKPHPGPLCASETDSLQSNNDNEHHTFNLPPGRPTNIFTRVLFDDTAKLLNPKDMKLLKRKQRFGSIFKTSFLLTPTVFITSKQGIANMGKLEARNKDTFQAFFPPHHQKMFRPHSLLVQSGPNHSRIRSLVMSSLTPTVVKSYEPLVQASIQQQEQSTSNHPYTKLVPKIRTLFTSIMLQVVLGTNNVADDLVEDLSIWAKGLVAPPLTMFPFTTAGKAMKARARVVDKLQQLMDDPESLQEDGLLKKLMNARDDENNTQLLHDEIIDNLFTLVFAGSDTTSAAATSMCKTLTMHPDIRQALWTDHATDATTTMETFVLQLLEAFPLAPFQMRQTTKELEFEGYRIPKGWLVCCGYVSALWDEHAPITVPSIRSSQTSSSDSDDDNNSSTHNTPAQSIAFGLGPRMCPGRFLAVS